MIYCKYTTLNDTIHCLTIRPEYEITLTFFC
jgi:hypothetical protein